MTHLDDYVVRPATHAQWLETHPRQYAIWGTGLTFEQFQEREIQVCKRTRLGQTSFHAWVLVPKDDTETLDFPSSCESYERTVYYRDEDGRRYEKTCHSIASVFTAEKHRKKGYAQRMMSLLHDTLVAQGCIASVLYSDVGDFYSRCTRLPTALAGSSSGWDVEGPIHAEWQVSAVGPPAKEEAAHKLQENDLDDIGALDANLLQKEIEAKDGPAMCILPSGPGFEWRLARTTIYEQHFLAQGKRTGLPTLSETGWGVELGSRDTPESWAFALWAYDLAEKELIILRLRCTDPKQLGVIVNKAAEAARAQGMGKITAWNLDQKLAEQADGKVVRRKEHLPALAWYGKRERPQWIANENWAWC